jgi:regulator of sigma E protease
VGFVTTVIAFLVALAVLIVVHELGHYSVARLCGVKVLRFSVGFGRPLRTWVRGADRTEWVIAAVPFGGYVRMLDERETGAEPISASDLPRAFNRQSVLRRSAIVVAGPVANLLLAIGVYTVMSMVGETDLRTVVAQPAAGTPAAVAGLQANDDIVGVDREPVRSWRELSWALLRNAMEHARPALTVRDPQGGERQLALDLGAVDTEHLDSDLMEKIGVRPGDAEPLVAALIPGEPAQAAGVRVGDRFVQVDGVAVVGSSDVTRGVQAATGRMVHFKILRDGVPVELSIAPAEVRGPDGKTIARIGVQFRNTLRVRYGPLPALHIAVMRTWNTSDLMLRTLGRMIVGRASVKNLAGPASIAQAAGQSFRYGPMAYLGFLAFVSVSLGVLNLLPVPVLDGGHLLYYAIEVVKGSPPSATWLELGQRLGVGLLVILMALALYNDLSRLLFQ